jgi:hypothetical protein
VPHQIVAAAIQSQRIGAEAGSRLPFICALRDDIMSRASTAGYSKNARRPGIFLCDTEDLDKQGQLRRARFTQPQGVSIDCPGNLRVADGGVFRTLQFNTGLYAWHFKTLSAASAGANLDDGDALLHRIG